MAFVRSTIRGAARSRRWWLVGLPIVAFLGIGAVVVATQLPATRNEPGEPRWGVIGPYEGIPLDDVRRRGIDVLMLDVRWSRAEPRDGSFDERYLLERRQEFDRYRAAGFDVVLNFGMHDAPDWLLDRPNARFVNQFGRTYRGPGELNLVFARDLRPYAERYVARLFAVLGSEFMAVRVGGGRFGELTYPPALESADGRGNDYWAFDEAALRQTPVPGWVPGMPSPFGEADEFIDWYLDALGDFQNWQVGMVRRSFSGTIGVLYPSWGVRDGDVAKAVAANLDGATKAERNNELQRGYDHARHIAALTDDGAAVWGTWADRDGTLDWLGALAAARGVAILAENSGFDGPVEMATAVREARENGVEAFLWVRADQAACRCEGWATFDDYEAAIRERQR